MFGAMIARLSIHSLELDGNDDGDNDHDDHYREDKYEKS